MLLNHKNDNEYKFKNDNIYIYIFFNIFWFSVTFVFVFSAFNDPFYQNPYILIFIMIFVIFGIIILIATLVGVIFAYIKLNDLGIIIKRRKIKTYEWNKIEKIIASYYDKEGEIEDLTIFKIGEKESKNHVYYSKKRKIHFIEVLSHYLELYPNIKFEWLKVERPSD